MAGEMLWLLKVMFMFGRGKAALEGEELLSGAQSVSILQLLGRRAWKHPGGKNVSVEMNSSKQRDVKQEST